MRDDVSALVRFEGCTPDEAEEALARFGDNMYRAAHWLREHVRLGCTWGVLARRALEAADREFPIDTG